MSAVPNRRWENVEDAIAAQLGGLTDAPIEVFDGPTDLLAYVPKAAPPVIVLSWQGASYTSRWATEGRADSSGEAKFFVLLFVESGAGAGAARRGEGGGFDLVRQIADRLHGFTLENLPPLTFTGPLMLADEVTPEIIGAAVRMGVMFQIGVMHTARRPATYAG